MKKINKLTAVLLCVALLLSVMPVISANATTDTETLYNNESAQTAEETVEPYIVGELTQKRTQNAKHFLMSDRSIMAAVYNKDIHYKNGDTWEDIDNSFSATDGGNDYQNKSNSVKTKFSKKSNGKKLVTIDKDGFSLSWWLEDADKVDAVLSQSDNTASDDMSALKNIEGSITYPEIKGNVDLQYIVSGSDIKENIILKNQDAPLEYTFTYETKKLKYRTNEQNQIEFYDENDNENTVFIIDVPYMYDSDKAYSADIEMQITETNKGLVLTLIPDEEWLLSEDRVYPVVIDPPIFNEKDARNIWDITLQQGQTTDLGYKTKELLVGSDTSGNVYRTLMRFVELPEIDVGGIVVNAKMVITAYPGSYAATVPYKKTRPTDDIQVNIHRVTANWPQQGAIWSNYADSYNSTVEDYFIYNDTDDGFVADITKLVSGWYSGEIPNYGVMIKANNEAAANHVMQFTASDWGDPQNDVHMSWRPILTVNYRNCVGIEDYWSYTTQDMGGYGTGYVNNYNGNLTYIHDNVSFNSGITGFTLSHVYNSSNTVKEATDADGNVSIVAADTGRYGKGWGLNLVQRFEVVTIDNNDKVKFVYTDGDGTKHYFVELEDKSIVDEDGLGYTYSSLNGTEIVHQITDKDGNILKFDKWGALRRIIDANGNTINLNYSPVTNQFNYLTSITTSSGGAVSLQYDSNYVLTSITDKAGRKTYFSYTSGNLTQIKYPDNTVLKFGYYSGANGVAGSSSRLQCVTLPNEFKYRYSNLNDGKVYTATTETASNTQGNKLTFTYGNNMTKVTDSDSRSIQYQFDNFGRVTCAYDSDGNSYSETYTPKSEAKEGIFANNKLSVTSSNIKYINNYITNSIFANDLSSWTQYKEAPNETQISVVTDQGYLSQKSAKITSTASSIQALIQYPSTTAGKTYTLSANIKTENVVSATRGAGVEIVTSSSTGNKYYYSDFLTGTTNTEVNNGFVTSSVTAVMASDEKIIRISVGLYNASGTVWIDSVQLEAGDTANKINMLSNSSFESGSTAGYTTNFGTSTGNGASTAQKQSGSYSCKIAGYSSQTRSIRQKVNITGKSGDVYSVGGWGKAYTVPVTYSDLAKKPNFRMYLNVYNGANIVEAFEIKFNEYVSDWQYVSKAIVLKKDYTALEVFFTYDYNCNTAYFDNMFLYRDTANSYTYDKDGNVVSTADYAAQQSTFEYSDNNLTKVINPNGTEYTYEYDDNNNLKKASSNIGVDYTYGYDSHGNATSTMVSSDEAEEKITSSATYQNNGNYPHTVTDSRGNVTTYTYDTARGLQTGVTDAKGNSTTYSYNSLNDRLESVTSGSSTVGYNYDSNSILQGITSPSGTVYNFTYDEFGNRTETKVGSQTLSINTYDTTQGLLTSVYYGNVWTVGYNYNILDQITEKLYNDVVKVKYRYDKFGNLYEKQDLFTGVTYRYSYDLIGRITGVTGSDSTSLNYVYDDYNRVEKFISKVSDNTNVTEYIYGDSAVSGQKDGLIYGVKQNGTKRISYSYDDLSRLYERKINTTTKFLMQYHYLTDYTADTTTTLVRSMIVGDNTLNYFHDEFGNIIEFAENANTIETYTYDSLNQLKTVTRGDDVYEYTYDNGGNILSVTRNGNATKGFTYGNAEWKDLLTAYNGMEITYDAIGNPRKYYDGTRFYWQYGRRLWGVKTTSGVTKYTYNGDGLRTTKNVDGTVTNYYWSDGMLLGEKTGDNLIVYLYDENGVAYGMIYNGTYYYYFQNAQGDIIGIIDADGNVVVEYEYSAWGEILSITGTLASTIGKINPLRYRGYYYDNETGFYYLQSRYYDPVICRFINADGQLNTQEGATGYNLFQYCGNNPVNRTDPTGQAWWHWALGAAVVVGCALATVATCGGFAAAVGAVAAVGSGVAAATTASTIAAGAFIGSATVYGIAVVTAASTSNSIQEFNDQGNWGTVAATAGGAVVGGAGAYLGTKGSNTTPSTTKPKVTSTIKNDVIDLPRTGSALKTDPYHAFPNIVDNYAGYATKSPISNGTLYQLQGSLNGTVGRFEWIIQNQQVTHRMFVPGGGINGIPIMP